MLTIAKLAAASVAYYESTVASGAGASAVDYYGENGASPARVWAMGDSSEALSILGVNAGEEVDGELVHEWINCRFSVRTRQSAGASQATLPGYDLTFCAPKSVSVLWGLTEDREVRRAVAYAHEMAVADGLAYLEQHAGYTRRGKGGAVIERLRGLVGVRYEHKTSRAGDPHIHSHVLLANYQRTQDGRWRTVDGKSLYHEARAAGMIYQATLRQHLTASLGVSWGERENGMADIVGLDNPDLIARFSQRSSEIQEWIEENDLRDSYDLGCVGQKQTRRKKDLSTTPETARPTWREEYGSVVDEFVASLHRTPDGHGEGQEHLPTPEAVLAAVIQEHSTFTRADVVEMAASMMPVGVENPREVVEQIASYALAEWSISINPEEDRRVNVGAREGAQRFTTMEVVQEVNRAVDLAAQEVWEPRVRELVQPVEGVLSVQQADAVNQILGSSQLVSALIAPAGAGKTSSLKAARAAWEKAGIRVFGLAPTGKAADIMRQEGAVEQAWTLAKIVQQIRSGRGLPLKDAVIVVDEAGMASTPDLVTLLEAAHRVGSKVVLVGDPYQYGAVKARGGLLATLAYELPDTAQLTEIWRQKDPEERKATQLLRTGDEACVSVAAQWYQAHDRLAAGSVASMLDAAFAGWKRDTADGLDSLMVASTNELVTGLNAAALRHIYGGQPPVGERVTLADGLVVGQGCVIITKKNDYAMTTDVGHGDSVRNGQRWEIEDITEQGLAVRRVDDGAHTVLPLTYVAEHVQVGYAVTGHASQGATVDTAHVVALAGQVDSAGVYVPMTRGRQGNWLYMAEKRPGDESTSHGNTAPQARVESPEEAARLLIAAATTTKRDESPHQLWRQARLDHELAALASGCRDPRVPAGLDSRFSDMMAHREQLRSQRHEAHAERVAGSIVHHDSVVPAGWEHTFMLDHIDIITRNIERKKEENAKLRETAEYQDAAAQWMAKQQQMKDAEAEQMNVIAQLAQEKKELGGALVACQKAIESLQTQVQQSKELLAKFGDVRSKLEKKELSSSAMEGYVRKWERGAAVLAGRGVKIDALGSSVIHALERKKALKVIAEIMAEGEGFVARCNEGISAHQARVEAIGVRQKELPGEEKTAKVERLRIRQEANLISISSPKPVQEYNRRAALIERLNGYLKHAQQLHEQAVQGGGKPVNISSYLQEVASEPVLKRFSNARVAANGCDLATFKGVRFNHCEVKDLAYRGTFDCLEDVTFENCTLSAMQIRNVQLSNVVMDSVTLKDSAIDRCLFVNTKVKNIAKENVAMRENKILCATDEKIREMVAELGFGGFRVNQPTRTVAHNVEEPIYEEPLQHQPTHHFPQYGNSFDQYHANTNDYGQGMSL